MFCGDWTYGAPGQLPNQALRCGGDDRIAITRRGLADALGLPTALPGCDPGRPMRAELPVSELIANGRIRGNQTKVSRASRLKNMLPSH